MLAPATLPPEYIAWNREHRAPFGPRRSSALLESRCLGRFGYSPAPGKVAWRHRMKFPPALIRKIGPFGFQSSSLTRTFEYPWCFFATPLATGMRVVEIGAGV